jgi:hypothetical protein
MKPAPPVTNIDTPPPFAKVPVSLWDRGKQELHIIGTPAALQFATLAATLKIFLRRREILLTTKPS